ncbi:MAG TPA: 50S ribosomal protein L25 [Gemmatimonadales bacterium]|jgi:large subunit ribosomal protein L25|nr:50S ribosomal protein L25 [Gemmatimonadales bacterium]
MANQVKLAAGSRTTTGKGAARTARRNGKVPAVIYGHGREAEALELDGAALGKALQGASAATVLQVTVDDRAPVSALIREVQRDPLRSSTVLHLDLYEIHADQKITVSVPVHLKGVPDGVRNFGGVLDHVRRELEVECFPADLPEFIDVDVTALTIGHSVFVRDIVFEKGEILDDPDQPVATVVAPRTEETATPAVATEEAAPSEPELIRKPKAEDQEEEA